MNVENISFSDETCVQHLDLNSAFIKSLCGNDPNAALYWLARMIADGEEPLFIARRMLIFASEDIGNANPHALLLAQACFQSVDIIGMPGSQWILSQTVIYLATSAKIDSANMGCEVAIAQAKEYDDSP